MKRRLPGRYLFFGLLAGAAWGATGLALAGRMLGASVWGGVLAAPAIGLLVAIAFRGFRGRPPAHRITLSLVSLYLAAGLFALAAGVADAARPIANRDPVAVVIQAILGVWWGITFAGYLPLLWPLAYMTHALLGRADAGDGEGDVSYADVGYAAPIFQAYPLFEFFSLDTHREKFDYSVREDGIFVTRNPGSLADTFSADPVLYIEAAEVFRRYRPAPQ